MQGGKVVFELISQFYREENYATDEIERIFDIKIEVGFTGHFKGFENFGCQYRASAVAKDSCIQSHHFKVTIDNVTDTMITANAFGNEEKKAKAPSKHKV